MGFLKKRQPADSPEDMAAAARLKAVTGRGSAERIAYPQIRVPDEAAEPPSPRLFWTPDQMAAA